MMSPSVDGTQMSVIVSDKSELRRCIMHLWQTYNGLGLNLKNSKKDGHSPHIVKDVDPNSPAHYAGVLSNDLVIKVGNKVVEYEKFDTVLKLIREQLKREKKVDLVLVNSQYYNEFKQKNERNGKKIDYNSSFILAQMKYYESPIYNPNSIGKAVKSQSVNNLTNPITRMSNNSDLPPEPRLCHLLTWSNYDGYGFCAAYNSDGVLVKNVEPNSPAQMGGLRDYDRIIEINGKHVHPRDKEAISKIITKHKEGFNVKGSAGTIKSHSNYSVDTNKSAKSGKSAAALSQIPPSNNSYLNILVVDPNTFNLLNRKKIEISSRNKSLKIQECYTPAEGEVQQILEKQRQQQIEEQQLYNRATPVNDNRLSDKFIIIKKCIVRKLKGKEDKPLGFEMTKRGNIPHYISRIEPNSAADLSGLSVDDYLIELNGKNIEKDENSLLREKILKLLDPKNNTTNEFCLTTINKDGFDYCTENKLSPSNFIQINKQTIQYFETPIELSVGPIKSSTTLHSNEELAANPIITNLQTIDINSEKRVDAVTHNISPSSNVNSEIMSQKGVPRLCVLHKTPDVRELGFSVARIKNFDEHIINDVVSNSLADQAGLHPNDILIEVNGENVENMTHAETVNRIIELARQPETDIKLLVVERMPTMVNQLKLNSQDQHSPASSNKSKNTLKLSNNTESNQNSIRKIDNLLPNLMIGSDKSTINSQNVNVYPEIKVCEFFGYPTGTQLGLVVTSDDYSHDVIKVAEDTPAYKAGICKGDIIIAVNDQNVEGNPAAIELLNEFSETRPLKVLVASRYAYEWSKLLRIRIVEKEWPNIKKFSTKYLHPPPIQNNMRLTPTHHNGSLYAPSNLNDPNSRNILMRNEVITTDNFNNNNYSYTNDALMNNTRYIGNMQQHEGSTRLAKTYVNNYIKSPRNHQGISNNGTVRSFNNNIDQVSLLSTLSRSAVDITADGKVLRMCTLILDPTSPIPTDSEFGFDLVTKVSAGIRTGDYYIDTVDEESPASVSGLKSGDRIVEVDGIDVSNKTFEQVVQLINEAKLKLKLKLLVYPSVVINYGNPSMSNNLNNFQVMQKQEEEQQQRLNYDNFNKSMPDLTFQQQQQQQHVNSQDFQNKKQNEFSKNLHKPKKTVLAMTTNNSNKNSINDYDSIYAKKNFNENNLASTASMSKSFSNINGTINSNFDNSFFLQNLNKTNQDLLRPVPRLCKIYKNDQMHLQSSQSSSNIGFGVQTKMSSNAMPNFIRISLVNYKSPAYLSGLEAGDFIIEINGRNTLSMTHDEALHFIKSSYDHNNYVNLLVVSEFCYSWLKEHDLLSTINTDDRSVFSYSDYLKNNHRYVPRLCKIKLFPFSKTFGFSLETLFVRQTVSANKDTKYQSYAHIVIRVEKDSPAYVSNLQKGDRIIECDGINVEAENEKEITDRIYQAFISAKQITVFVVDPDTDNFFKAKCIKLHSMLPIVQHITNSTDI